ncbi:hypothetical protein ACLKA7_004295 [Drosophila subpalustris]
MHITPRKRQTPDLRDSQKLEPIIKINNDETTATTTTTTTIAVSLASKGQLIVQHGINVTTHGIWHFPGVLFAACNKWSDNKWQPFKIFTTDATTAA